jgi:hypothetical protein
MTLPAIIPTISDSIPIIAYSITGSIVVDWFVFGMQIVPFYGVIKSS